MTPARIVRAGARNVYLVLGTALAALAFTTAAAAAEPSGGQQLVTLLSAAGGGSLLGAGVMWGRLTARIEDLERERESAKVEIQRSLDRIDRELAELRRLITERIATPPRYDRRASRAD